jgi:hypothetical protein
MATSGQRGEREYRGFQVVGTSAAPSFFFDEADVDRDDPDLVLYDIRSPRNRARWSPTWIGAKPQGLVLARRAGDVTEVVFASGVVGDAFKAAELIDRVAIETMCDGRRLALGPVVADRLEGQLTQRGLRVEGDGLVDGLFDVRDVVESFRHSGHAQETVLKVGQSGVYGVLRSSMPALVQFDDGAVNEMSDVPRSMRELLVAFSQPQWRATRFRTSGEGWRRFDTLRGFDLDFAPREIALAPALVPELHRERVDLNAVAKSPGQWARDFRLDAHNLRLQAIVAPEDSVCLLKLDKSIGHYDVPMASFVAELSDGAVHIRDEPGALPLNRPELAFLRRAVVEFGRACGVGSVTFAAGSVLGFGAQAGSLWESTLRLEVPSADSPSPHL